MSKNKKLLGLILFSALMVPFNNCSKLGKSQLSLESGESSLSSETSSPGNAFSCNSNEQPSSLDARRLSKAEYANSLQSLLARAIGDAEAAALLTQINVQGKIPDDVSTAFTTGDKNFSAIHAREYFEIADQVSTALVAAGRYDRFVNTYINYNRGTCVFTATSNLNVDCRTTLARNFILRAWGRPLESTSDNLNNELAAFTQEFQLAATTTTGVEAMIFKALMSPQFLYHLQISVTPTAQAGIHQLSSYAIARRLAYIFTQTIADETLLNLAATRNLADEAAFSEALNLVVTKMDSTLGQFTKEWLHLNSLPTFIEQTHPKFQLITQGITVNENLKTVMANEVTELVNYINKNNRPATELFTTNISFARDPNLMRIYGLTQAAPTTITEQNAVRFPANERSGLLTRSAMLLSGGHTENPIKRGIHIRKYIMCLKMADPPQGLPVDTFTPPVPNINLTTRERYHNKTSGASCIGCHSQINPIGFAFTKYNAFGAVQNNEPIYDANNQLSRYLPTDSRVDLQIALGLFLNTNDAIDFSQVVSTTTQFKKCMTENFYTYANGLSEKPTSTSSCNMSRMYQQLDGGSTLQDFFKSTVQDSRFKLRVINR